MPFSNHWRLVDILELHQAVALLCECEPLHHPLATPPAACNFAALKQRLLESIRRGEIRAAGWTQFLSVRLPRIARADLVSWAHANGIKSSFLRESPIRAFNLPAVGVNAETECKKWLQQEMAEPPEGPRKHYFDEARQRWPGLSERAFDRAWGGAAASSSCGAEWIKAGRKRRKQSPH